MKKLLLSLLIIFESITGFSQSYGEVGVFGGGVYYIGDLNPDKHFLLTKPALGIFLRHNFNDRLAIKLAGTYGSITSNDYIVERNLNFKSKITDINVSFEINFFEYFIGSGRDFITPYMFGGAGVVFFNPQGLLDGNYYELQPLGTEGQNSEVFPDRDPYRKLAFTIPFGIGVKYSLNDKVGLSLHWSMNKTYSDYIDDVSTTYYLNNFDEAKIDDVLSDPTLNHNKDMQRGNSKNNDWYSYAGVSISYKINYFSNQKCINVYF